jgi:diacylglycerol kinase (ATP)
MTTVAVVAHSGKSLGGGLDELRRVLADEGVTEPLWYEVPKSRKASKSARRAVDAGADLVFAWGGDGTVQRCIDALAGSGAALAILPAGTANLLATNLNVPTDLAHAVRIGLHGRRHQLDTGRINGEHFAVMAGAGFDARMIARSDAAMKDRLGRVAYVWTGARSTHAPRVKASVRVDGRVFHKGKVACVLIGNVSQILGGIRVFPDSRPDDGRLELGVLTAHGTAQWARTLGRVATERAEKSPFVRSTQGTKFDIRFDKPVVYELDGGTRRAVKHLRVRVRPASVTVCLPEAPNL